MEQKHALTESEAALYIGLSRSYLRKDRCEGHRPATPGPPYIRVGTAIRYLVSDLDAWLNKHRVVPKKTDADY